jgi:hydroxyacylglutathione hydrolase
MIASGQNITGVIRYRCPLITGPVPEHNVFYLVIFKSTIRKSMNEGNEQYVCQSCGYNMVGYHPDFCPFCGATKERFLPGDENSTRHHVEGMQVNACVTRFTTVPKLGYEHAAYRIVADGAVFLIDCPSTFDRSLPRMDTIVFTHHHFLGACNQYRDLFPARVAIHEADVHHDLCRGFTFDDRFLGSYCDGGLHAMHLGGHTPGFTCYFFREVLFICDYVMREKGAMILNPYGPRSATREGLVYLMGQIKDFPVSTVCGVDYIMDYPLWEKLVLPLTR